MDLQDFPLDLRSGDGFVGPALQLQVSQVHQLQLAGQTHGTPLARSVLQPVRVAARPNQPEIAAIGGIARGTSSGF